MTRPKQSLFPNGLSPVQKKGDVWLKREDLWFRGEAHGSKCKVGFKLAGQTPKALVGGSHRTSPQAERIALIADELGVPAHVHTAAAADESDIIKRCRRLGAEIHEHRPGYMNVILKRARDHAESDDDFVHIPWGMESQVYIDEVAKQVQNIPKRVRRIVVPLGSGMALSGVLQGLARLGEELPVVAISVGSQGFQKRLDAFAPEAWRETIQVFQSQYPFEKMVFKDIHGVSLDPQYEAKCVDYLQPGDLLWCVAHRDHPRDRQ